MKIKKSSQNKINQNLSLSPDKNEVWKFSPRRCVCTRSQLTRGHAFRRLLSPLKFTVLIYLLLKPAVSNVKRDFVTCKNKTKQTKNKPSHPQLPVIIFKKSPEIKKIKLLRRGLIPHNRHRFLCAARSIPAGWLSGGPADRRLNMWLSGSEEWHAETSRLLQVLPYYIPEKEQTIVCETSD